MRLLPSQMGRPAVRLLACLPWPFWLKHLPVVLLILDWFLSPAAPSRCWPCLSCCACSLVAHVFVFVFPCALWAGFVRLLPPHTGLPPLGFSRCLCLLFFVFCFVLLLFFGCSAFVCFCLFLLFPSFCLLFPFVVVVVVVCFWVSGAQLCAGSSGLVRGHTHESAGLPFLGGFVRPFHGHPQLCAGSSGLVRGCCCCCCFCVLLLLLFCCCFVVVAVFFLLFVSFVFLPWFLFPSLSPASCPPGFLVVRPLGS